MEQENQVEGQENTGAAQEGELELNWDILEKQEGTVSTLGEQYGYDVFSEEFGDGVTRVRQEEKAAEEAAFEQVFRGEAADTTEAAFEAVFSAQPQTVVKADYSTGAQTGRSIGFAVGFTLAGMLLTGGVLYLLGKRKKGARNAADNHGDR